MTATRGVEYRAAGPVALQAGGAGAVFVGQIRFGQRSAPISAGTVGSFVEVIDPKAFARSLASGADVLALRDHNPGLLLGRLSTGTLRISTDATALRFEVDAPDTSYARDLGALLARGDVAGASFSFWVPPGGDAWAYDSNGLPLRTLTNVDLKDVTICAAPAYPTSTSALGQPSRSPMPMPVMPGRSAGSGAAWLVEARQLVLNRRRLELYRRRRPYHTR